MTEGHRGHTRRSSFYCDRAQNSHKAQKSKQTCLLAGQKHATFEREDLIQLIMLTDNCE